MESEIKVIRSNRKTLAVEITPNLGIIVRAPKSCSDKRISEFITEHTGWIIRALERQKRKQASVENLAKFTENDLKNMRKIAKEIIPKKVDYFAKLIGVKYKSIRFSLAKTRWGSCNKYGALSFNILLMNFDDSVIDYVVVHELCHIKELNHSARFWKEVEKIIPDYKMRRKKLKDRSNEILKRAF